MTPDRHPRWKRKRWLAAGLLWVPLAYPVATLAACYCAGRSWLPERPVLRIYLPASLVIGDAPGEWALNAGLRYARESR